MTMIKMDPDCLPANERGKMKLICLSSAIGIDFILKPFHILIRKQTNCYLSHLCPYIAMLILHPFSLNVGHGFF